MRDAFSAALSLRSARVSGRRGRRDVSSTCGERSAQQYPALATRQPPCFVVPRHLWPRVCIQLAVSLTCMMALARDRRKQAITLAMVMSRRSRDGPLRTATGRQVAGGFASAKRPPPNRGDRVRGL